MNAAGTLQSNILIHGLSSGFQLLRGDVEDVIINAVDSYGTPPQINDGGPAQVARFATRDVPATEPLEQRLVAGREQIDDVDASVVDAGSRAAPVGWAHLLALVTAVDAVTQCGAVLEREVALRLQQPRQATTRVDDPGRWERLGRAGAQARGAVAAQVGVGPVVAVVLTGWVAVSSHGAIVGIWI